MELGRCQSVNFGMKVDTSMVEGRKAQQVARKFEKWVSDVDSSAEVRVVGDKVLKFMVADKGRTSTITLKVNRAGKLLGKAVQRIENFLGLRQPVAAESKALLA